MVLNPKKISKFTDTELSDLFDEILPLLEQAYKKGLGVAITQLGPLNIEVTTRMGNSLSSDALKKVKDANQKYVNSLSDRYEQVIYDIVYDGMDKNRTLAQIMDNIHENTDKGILESKRYASSIIIDAARKGEIDLYRQANVGLFRDIAVVDGKTCGVCLGLNGNIYKEGFDERGLINYDTKEFLIDDISRLATENGLEDWIVPEDGADGPPYHDVGACRCHLAPVITFEDYKGNVQQTISEVE
jgi:hypothetical protein